MGRPGVGRVEKISSAYTLVWGTFETLILRDNIMETIEYYQIYYRQYTDKNVEIRSGLSNHLACGNEPWRMTSWSEQSI